MPANRLTLRAQLQPVDTCYEDQIRRLVRASELLARGNLRRMAQLVTEADTSKIAGDLPNQSMRPAQKI